MSAAGEIYATEVCEGFAEKELDKTFGKRKWCLDGTPFMELWDERNFPDVMEIPVNNDEGDQIGLLVVENEFFIEEGMSGKYIEVEPKRIVKIEKR